MTNEVSDRKALIAALSGVSVEGTPYPQGYLVDLVNTFYGDAEVEHQELVALRRLLTDCDRFIDVGANVGQHTYNASLVMTAGELVAIEANPFLIPVLQTLAEHVERAGHHTVQVVHAAVTNREELTRFFLPWNVAQGGSLVRRSEPGMDTEVTVNAIALDTLYRRSRKTIVKIDVEGAEYRVLASAERFLSSDHTMFFVELHGWGDQTIEMYPLDVCGFLLLKGYALRHIGARASNHYLFYRAGVVERICRYLAVAPRFGLMAFVYRYARPTIPVWRRIRRWTLG